VGERSGRRYERQPFENDPTEAMKRQRTAKLRYRKGARGRGARAAETMAAYMPLADPAQGVSGLQRHVDEVIERMPVVDDLVALREDRGLSQSQVALLLGVSQPAIAKLESGRVRNLELRTLVRYATALGARIVIHVERLAATRRSMPRE
jgi:predicted XRE-type DNA-binding protein